MRLRESRKIISVCTLLVFCIGIDGDRAIAGMYETSEFRAESSKYRVLVRGPIFPEGKAGQGCYSNCDYEINILEKSTKKEEKKHIKINGWTIESMLIQGDFFTF